MEEKEIETWYNLVNLNWSKKKVLGIVDKNLEFFCPFTHDFFEKLVKGSARPGPFLDNDPCYKAMKEYMETQQKEAEQIASDMARMSGDERKNFITNHVDIITPSDELKKEVLDWLVALCNTPEGRQNIALAMGSYEGGDDGKFSIHLGTKEDLNGAGGWASTGGSMIMLSEESWKNQGDWNKNNTIPHEICHLGQEDVENLSNREWALYNALLVEAQARLVEFCDGVTEGRNDNFKGFLHSLNDDLDAVVEDLKKSGVLKENMTPDDFIKLKDTNHPQYDLIMGRIKEKQFSCVLNNLGKYPLYQRQGLGERSGPGNLTALKAWVDVVCERTGMRKDVTWPEVHAMATGTKEIPGYENCFTKEGKRSTIGVQKHELAQKLIDLGFGSSIISSWVKEGNEITIEDEDRDKCVCTLDENGQLKEANVTYADGDKCVYSFEKGQLKEANVTFVNGDKCVCSYENGHLIERWDSPKPLGEYIGIEPSKRKWKSDKGNRRIDTIVDGKTVVEEYTDKKGDKYKEVSRGAGVTTTTEFGVGEKPKTQITKFANGTVMTKEFGSKTNKIIVKEPDGRETVRFEDKDGKLLPEDYTEEIKEQPSVASESENDKVEAKKSLGNGKGLDDKLQARQQAEAQKSLGNGKGLDDKLQARQPVEAQKSLGNGKGLDDKLQAKQQAEERVAKVARTKGKGQNA